MRLALGLGDVNEVSLVKPIGADEDGCGDGNFVVAGKSMDYLDRRIVDRREPAGEFRACLDLDFGRQPSDDIVEQPDMPVVELIRPLDEQVGDAAQRLDAFAARAALDRVLEFKDQGFAGDH